MKLRNTFSNYFQGGSAAIGLLALRLIVGYAFVQHGFPKMFANGQLNAFSWMGPDAAMPGILQAAAAFAEFFGGLTLMAGLLTPLASLGILTTMLVAIGTVHKGAPFVAPSGQHSFELAGVYFAVMLALLLTGPGAYSVDRLLARVVRRDARRVEATSRPVTA